MSTPITSSLDDGRISFGDPQTKDARTDPVCGSAVDGEDESAPRASHEGRTFYFCSTACKQRFEEDPETYL